MRAKRQELMAQVLEQRPPRPDSETPPMMVSDISHLVRAVMRANEPEGCMTQHSARHILRLLAHESGISQSELARRAHLSAPSVSATLRRMEGEGLVVRRACEHDARAVGVYLTEKGQAHHESVRAYLGELDGILMRGFTPEETERLSDMLSRMRENLVATLCHEATGEENE